MKLESTAQKPLIVKYHDDDLPLGNIDEKQIRESLKAFFSDKRNLSETYCPEGNRYHFRYTEDIENFADVPLNVEIAISADDVLLSITISTPYDEARADLNEYDLQHYCDRMRHFFTRIALNTSKAKEALKEYTVRVYQKIVHDIGFRGTYVVRFLSHKIAFKPLFEEAWENCPVERIIAFDCEVSALSLADARSQAINLVKQFAAFLSPLLGVGFEDIQRSYAHFVNEIYYPLHSEDSEQEYELELNSEFQQTAFVDKDIGGEDDALLVKDNMNGLYHLGDYNEGGNLLPFLSLRFIDGDGKIGGSVIQNAPAQTFENLERLFSETHRIEKTRTPRGSDDDTMGGVTVPATINRYFQKISALPESDYNRLLGSCALHNAAFVHGRNEATLMVSFLVSSVEALAKMEKTDFTPFMRKYLGKSCDKKLCAFLYGSIRSGFFHSGETYFLEYDCHLDVSLHVRFERRLREFCEAIDCLRKAYEAWIERFLLAT